ncbi:hypothetical protein M758_12G083100 [Ceratodon purpureus]|uniref:phosphoserine phosphatase n=1 Tax=Ceratodon purpureus TaxID=3225 RepID=A0A8T0G737_CERPU|nr:hypothetical protein KC19_12G080600 [Ceratodon purpureus]KAG0598543.1 hypothetical protein M758_12G083100 [Ceratodon purpureus]
MATLRSRLVPSSSCSFARRTGEAVSVRSPQGVKFQSLSSFGSWKVVAGETRLALREAGGGVMVAHAGSGENATSSGSLAAEVVATWQNAQAVCFDVDSTVCEDEGIDELAAFCGAGDAVAAWTARAMGGSVPFEDALAARLALFRPSVKTLAKFLDTRPPRFSKGIRELVSKLQSRGTDVYLVSGGFRQMIAPVAAQLHIPSDNVFANTLLFGDDGEFTGFDATEPTSRSGGKAQAIEQIKKEHGYQTLVMIGDGATDLEARRPGGADLFICYGGVVARPSVVAGADWFVTSFKDLIESLD